MPKESTGLASPLGTVPRPHDPHGAHKKDSVSFQLREINEQDPALVACVFLPLWLECTIWGAHIRVRACVYTGIPGFIVLRFIGLGR